MQPGDILHYPNITYTIATTTVIEVAETQTTQDSKSSHLILEATDIVLITIGSAIVLVAICGLVLHHCRPKPKQRVIIQNKFKDTRMNPNISCSTLRDYRDYSRPLVSTSRRSSP
jgi:hypothetical protein